MEFTPVWLMPSDVADWLHLSPASADDTRLLGRACAAVEPEVQRYRPDGWPIPEGLPPVDPPTYAPTADIYQGAVMYAARVFRRRNTASGIETFADSITYVASRDPDVQAFLRTGPFARPRIG